MADVMTPTLPHNPDPTTATTAPPDATHTLRPRYHDAATRGGFNRIINQTYKTETVQ